jgi:ABC-type transport system substrate-binding protein
MKTMKTTRREFIRTVGVGATALAIPTVTWAPARAEDHKFKLYLTVFNNDQTRMIWSDMIGKNIAKLGIEVVTSFVAIPELLSRRSNDKGAIYMDGGFDMYTERYYYPSISPAPEQLFSKTAFPPAGKNFYRVNDDILEAAMQTFSKSPDEAGRKKAIDNFQKRWQEIEPINIIYYPVDVIATNPKLKGFAETTYQPVFFPRAENWTIEGGDGSAAFASWPAPTSLVPMFCAGYHESNVFGPVYNALMEYNNWKDKELVPALAESVTKSADGRVWKIKLRQGIQWHSGEPLSVEDVAFTWDTILDPAVGSVQAALLRQTFGDRSAYKIVSPTEIEVRLPEYNMLFETTVLPSISIMPRHAYSNIKPSEWRNHPISTWNGTYTVKTSSGKTYEAKGAIGTGPWIADGYDASRSAYKMRRNPNFWRKSPGDLKEFFVVNINGADAVLSALRAGEIDAHDPMYNVGTLAKTIDPSWATLNQFDSYKWQQTSLNLNHPVYGTGLDTPLGKSDPSKAAEAAVYVRKAFSHAIPREEIIKNVVGGFGVPGTVPIPYTAPEYDTANNKPIPYDLDKAREYMKRAGYTY